MRRAGAVGSREPVDPIRFARWVCRGCVVLDVVVVVVLLGAALGWGPDVGVVAVVLLILLVGVVAVLVRLSPVTTLAYPSGFAGARSEESDAATGSSVGEGREGWSCWSFPKRAETVERARAVRALTAALEGGPIGPSDRAAAGVHAYRQVAAYTQGTATGSLLLAVAGLQLLEPDAPGWPWVGAALLVGAAVVLVFNIRRAVRWQRIADNRELVEPPRET